MTPHDSANAARNGAANAACIAVEFQPNGLRGRLGFIEEAAVHLHVIESGESFDWEVQPNDWESVCYSIAQFIELHEETPDADTILEFIRH